MGRTLAAAAAALALALGARTAHAANLIERVEVTNGTFDDGGTFRGWFLLDLTTYSISRWGLVTTAGAALPGDRYETGGSDQFAFLFGPIAFGHIVRSGVDTLTFLPGGPTTFDAFETNGPCFLCAPNAERAGIGDYTVSNVPEPGLWALLILGVALAGTSLRRGPARAL